MMLEGVVIHPDGITCRVPLAVDPNERIAQLQALVSGHIEVVPLPGRRYFVCRDDIKAGPHVFNETASWIAWDADSIQRHDYLAGTVVLVPAAALN